MWAAVLASCLMTVATAGKCRQAPLAATSYCGLPYELSNYQGLFQCDEEVLVGRPADKTEVLDMIEYFPSVKANGVGHSWWSQQFCSGNTSSAINIVMTELNQTLNYINNPAGAACKTCSPAEIPIMVDETKMTAVVQGGVPTRMFLDYLAAYTTAKSPLGYSLPAFPWYIDQSIGGALATGTHGSSFRYGSLSSQVTRIELALANATLLNITAASNPHLWKAALVSVGRLGIITEMEFDIVPQQMLTRTGSNVKWPDFQAAIIKLQNDYNAVLNGTDDRAVEDVLDPWEGTQLIWFVGQGRAYQVQYAQLEQAVQQDGDPATASFQATITSDPAAAAPMAGMAGMAMPLAPGAEPGDVYAQTPSPALGPSALLKSNPQAWNQIYNSIVVALFPNGTFSTRQAILAENELANKQTSDADPYDQYEASVPLETAGDCITLIGDAIYGRNLSSGFAVPPLIRFTGGPEAGGELGYIGTGQGGPRLHFNIEDHLSRSTGHDNVPFQEVVGIFVEQCGARFHWGKAGWPRYFPCFDGAEKFPDTWCDFGCAVQELDPTSKFSSLSNVWSWEATRNGQAVPFESCCSPTGFSAACTCAQRTSCA